MKFNVMSADFPNEHGEIYTKDFLEHAVGAAKSRMKIYGVDIPLLINEATVLEIYEGINPGKITGVCKDLYFDEKENCVKADFDFAGENGEILWNMIRDNVPFNIRITIVTKNIHSFYVEPLRLRNSRFVSCFDEGLLEEF